MLVIFVHLKFSLPPLNITGAIFQAEDTLKLIWYI